MPLSLTVIILAFNEERHLARCIESVSGIASRIVVVDSFSTDNTVTVARAHGAEVLQNRWKNYSTQFNWALDSCDIRSEWVMRLDADEIVTEELSAGLAQSLPRVPAGVAGLTVNRRIYFMGRWIRHGGIYPARMLRVWRAGLGRCESRWMDEHIVVNGIVEHMRGDIADVNLNNITWWTSKHNSYASREAVDLLLEGGASATEPLSGQAGLRRFLKRNVYRRTPIACRALLYFFYRYFVRGGFLDGWQGIVFHVLQGFWYRFLVDVKVYELRKIMKAEGITLDAAVQRELGLEIAAKSA